MISHLAKKSVIIATKTTHRCLLGTFVPVLHHTYQKKLGQRCTFCLLSDLSKIKPLHRVSKIRGLQKDFILLPVISL